MRGTALILQILVCSCAPQIAYIHKEMPAKLDVDRDEGIVVEGFSGRKGDEIRSLIESALVKNNFNTLERARFAPLVREGILKDKPIGLNAATFMVSGHVEEYNYRNNVSKYSTQCRTTDGTYNAISTAVTGIGKISVQVRFTDISSGKVLYSDSIEAIEERTVHSNGCDSPSHYRMSSSYRRPDDVAILARVKEKFVNDFLKIVKPYKATLAVELFSVDSDLLPELEEGHKLFKQSKLEEAARSYESAVREARARDLPQKVLGHALYAYGITLGYLGDRKSFDILNEAYLVNPEEKYRLEEAQMRDYFEVNGRMSEMNRKRISNSKVP